MLHLIRIIVILDEINLVLTQKPTANTITKYATMARISGHCRAVPLMLQTIPRPVYNAV